MRRLSVKTVARSRARNSCRPSRELRVMAAARMPGSLRPGWADAGDGAAVESSVAADVAAVRPAAACAVTAACARNDDPGDDGQDDDEARDEQRGVDGKPEDPPARARHEVTGRRRWRVAIAVPRSNLGRVRLVASLNDAGAFGPRGAGRVLLSIHAGRGAILGAGG